MSNGNNLHIPGFRYFSFMKTESKKTHEYQSGYYCKQNFLKFLIANVGIFMPDCIFTSADVENQIGIHRNKAGNALWHYKRASIPYFRRLPKKDPHGLIRWKVLPRRFDERTGRIFRTVIGFYSLKNVYWIK